MDAKTLCDLRRRRERRGFNQARARAKEYEPVVEEKASYNEEEIVTRGKYITPPENVDVVEAVGEVEFAFQKNPCLDGHPREDGLEDCVLKNAAVTSNKSEIARRCKCSPRTVYRILVEEDKQDTVMNIEVDFCEQCGEAFVGMEDEDGVVVCSNCGWERE